MGTKAKGAEMICISINFKNISICVEIFRKFALILRTWEYLCKIQEKIITLSNYKHDQVINFILPIYRNMLIDLCHPVGEMSQGLRELAAFPDD